MAPASGQSKRFLSPPKFFKIIKDSATDTSTSLMIPPEFMKRFGHNLPNRIFLRIPNWKKLTEVELNQVNGQTLMHGGWREFKRRLSLGHGHFLVFEYNGNSQFDVAVFDRSALEINYPSEESERESDVLLEVEDQENALPPENDVIVISDDDYTDKKPDESSYRNTRSQRPVDCRRAKSDESIDHYGDDSVTGTRRRPVVKETSAAYQRAVAFASRLNPHTTPFFISLMQKSYISCRFSLHLPLSFAGPSLSRAGANSVTLVTNGKKWSIRCRESGLRVSISGGWNGFVKDNLLKIGDVCIFEVANKGNKQHHAVWNVIIFRLC